MNSILHLQRTIGNQAVQRLLRGNTMDVEGDSTTTKIARFGHDFSRRLVYAKVPVKTQTNLTVNTPGDVYEQVADRIADQVIATPAYTAVSGAPPRIQRFSGQSHGRMDAAPASVDQALASPGRPPEPALRQDMEQRFGHGFSRVRVHSGAAAAQSAQDVNATAYMRGHNIVFGADRFAPGTHEGCRLIAHELTHVVQRSGLDGIRLDQSGEKRGLFPMPTLRYPAVTEIMRDKAAQPSPLWYEVYDAHFKLFTQIAGINAKSPSPTRSDWINKLSSSWGQVGEPGEKSDAELKKLRDDLNELKKEIAEEGAQARESWKAVVEVYREERKTLEAEDEEWRQDAIKILDGRYADTARTIQIAGASLTFDDLVPLEYMLNEKKHREYAQVRAERQQEGPGTGSTVATGAGLGAVVTYQGKTLVRLGGEKFYLSGTPPKGGWTPQGGTTSVFFIYKKSDPKKMYRLDYDTIKMGPQQGQKGWEHNQKGVAKILGLKVTNHQPAGGWARAAGTAIRIYKWGGRALFVAGLVGTALEIYYADNKVRAVAKAGGAIAGGIGGAKLGAAGGAEVGAFFGPIGAGVGAFFGGLIGGALGAWGGSKATEYVYDLVVEPLQDEDDWMVLTQDQVEPVPGAARSGE
jgi:hypothetical protein